MRSYNSIYFSAAGGGGCRVSQEPSWLHGALDTARCFLACNDQRGWLWSRWWDILDNITPDETQFDNICFVNDDMSS